MKIANINNLSLVAIAMERLMNRPDGLPGLGVLYGPSGYGKTTATVAVANSTQAYYVQLRSAWSKKTLLEKICFEMGIPAAKTTAANLDLICEQLAASQRPLILDEADYLVAKAGMVELVRDIYEGSQSPIMLVGEEMLPNKLKKYERFHGRVLNWLPAQAGIGERCRAAGAGVCARRGHRRGRASTYCGHCPRLGAACDRELG